MVKKCNVTTCEEPGTQLFTVLPIPEGATFVCTANTLFYSDGGEVTFVSPGDPVPLCPKHYDETVAYYRQASESDLPEAEDYRALIKLNN